MTYPRCILKRSDGHRCILANDHDGLCVFDSAAPPAPSFNPIRRASRDDLMAVRPPPMHAALPIPVPSDARRDEPPAAPVDIATAEVVTLATDVLAGRATSYVTAAERMAQFILARFGGPR